MVFFLETKIDFCHSELSHGTGRNAVAVKVISWR